MNKIYSVIALSIGLISTFPALAKSTEYQALCPSVESIRAHAGDLDAVSKEEYGKYNVYDRYYSAYAEESGIDWHIETNVRANNFEEAYQTGKRSIMSTERVENEIAEDLTSSFGCFYACAYLDASGHYSAYTFAFTEDLPYEDQKHCREVSLAAKGMQANPSKQEVVKQYKQVKSNR